MTNTKPRVYREAKKWEDHLPNGEVNLGSYRFDNCNRVVRMATVILVKEYGAAKASEVKRIADILMGVVNDATEAHTGRYVDPSMALWSAAWFTLTDWLEMFPLDMEDIDGWTARTTKYIAFTLGHAEQLTSDSLNK